MSTHSLEYTAASALMAKLPSGITTEADTLNQLYSFLLVWADGKYTNPSVVARNLTYYDEDFASNVISTMSFNGFKFYYPK
jgi:hypothetical protein